MKPKLLVQQLLGSLMAALSLLTVTAQPQFVGLAQFEDISHSGTIFKMNVDGTDFRSIHNFTDLKPHTDYSFGKRWPLGLYILNINTSGRISTQKVIKIKPHG